MINSIMAQFDVNPYHWPGWMHASLTATVALLTVFIFVETRSFSKAQLSCSTMTVYLNGLKLEARLQTKCKKFTVSYYKLYCRAHIAVGFKGMCTISMYKCNPIVP